jgi:hypothetical protein
MACKLLLLLLLSVYKFVCVLISSHHPSSSFSRGVSYFPLLIAFISLSYYFWLVGSVRRKTIFISPPSKLLFFFLLYLLLLFQPMGQSVGIVGCAKGARARDVSHVSTGGFILLLMNFAQFQTLTFVARSGPFSSFSSTVLAYGLAL